MKLSFPSLPTCTDELISAPKIIAFLPMLPSVNENSERESNPMRWPSYLYLSESAYLVSFSDPNKQLLNVISALAFLNSGSSV